MSCIFIFKYNDEVFNLLTERININHSYYGILQPSNSNNHVIYIYIQLIYNIPLGYFFLIMNSL